MEFFFGVCRSSFVQKEIDNTYRKQVKNVH